MSFSIFLSSIITREISLIIKLPEAKGEKWGLEVNFEMEPVVISLNDSEKHNEIIEQINDKM